MISPWSLRFLDPADENAYRAYRTPTITRFLGWLLPAGAVLIFVGSIIDFTRLGSDDAWLLTAIRVAAAIGMLAAWRIRIRPWAQRNIQLFVGIGVGLLHVFWLLSFAVIGANIADYVGVLPINIMVTFIVSGLMFQYAKWAGLAAGLIYGAALMVLHAAPTAPVVYLVLAGIYAGFAAYVAEKARRDAWSEAQALEAERRTSERLLLNVLPESIATRMKGGEVQIADRFDEAGVLFADIDGFTSMSRQMDPRELVHILDDIFRRFDAISRQLGLEKIKTIGDCYMAACGLPDGRPGDVRLLAEAAVAMRQTMADITRDHGRALSVRIGLHCGPVVAGVIGDSKFIYDLWGDTVNVASRLESSAEPAQIQMSQTVQCRLGKEWATAYRGEIDLKGRGIFAIWTLEGKST